MITIIVGAGIAAYYSWQKVNMQYAPPSKNGRASNTTLHIELPAPRIAPLFYDDLLFKRGITYAASRPQMVISHMRGAIVPHHLLASPIIADTIKTVAQEHPSVIILIGPNHHERGNANILTSTRAWDTPEGEVQPSREMIEKFLGSGLVQKDDDTFAQEHAIGGIAPFIKHYLPHAAIVPLIFKAGTTRAEIESLAAQISDTLKDERVFLLASIDFSHYLSSSEARKNDALTEAFIKKFDHESVLTLNNDHLDSPPSLAVLLLGLKQTGATRINAIHHSNSGDLLANPSAPVTSYFGTIFSLPPNRTNTLNIESSDTAFIAAGDIMLGRNVEAIGKSEGWEYPYQKIDALLEGVDIVMGNLEGPVPNKHVTTPVNSLKFSFPKESMKPLGERFNLLSLANNHTDNYGVQGLIETQEILRSEGITPIGHPSKIGPEFTAEKLIDGKSFHFIGFNATYPSFILPDAENFLHTIQPSVFTVITIHWGEEYTSHSNTRQQTIAHALIDAGADVIIGHHPHVVQEIERYHDRLIFYSLGNFIFDQYFSRATQESMLVKTTMLPEGTLKYELIPIHLFRSQPSSMASADAEIFLKNLARSSAKELQEEIMNGVVMSASR